MSKAKIYTRFGDKGKTRLVDGACVEKSNPRVEAYGCVDELNSALGIISSEIPKSTPLRPLLEPIETIQNHLFRVGSLLACSQPETLKSLPQINDTQVNFLEKEIDQMDEALPELKNFILPGGHPVAALFHLARTICRRAERKSSELFQQTENSEMTLIYLNRLSDYLFTAARWCNHTTGIVDKAWDQSR
jgi:cob(I)alamin adenosyltransferase